MANLRPVSVVQRLSQQEGWRREPGNVDGLDVG